jgi:hypothetical protein
MTIRSPGWLHIDDPKEAMPRFSGGTLNSTMGVLQILIGIATLWKTGLS